MKANERLWLTKDKEKVVPESDKNAATLFAAVGHKIPQSAVEKFKLFEGCASKASKAAAEEKSGNQGEDKSLKEKGGNKGGQNGNSGGGDKLPELTYLKGIGAAFAEKLTAAGITSIEDIAGFDPENLPTVEGIGANPDWAGWIEQAKQLIATE